MYTERLESSDDLLTLLAHGMSFWFCFILISDFVTVISFFIHSKPSPRAHLIYFVVTVNSYSFSYSGHHISHGIDSVHVISQKRLKYKTSYKHALTNITKWYSNIN